MTFKLHHTQISAFAKHGISPIIDNGAISVVIAGTPRQITSTRDVVQAIKDHVAADGIKLTAIDHPAPKAKTPARKAAKGKSTKAPKGKAKAKARRVAKPRKAPTSRRVRPDGAAKSGKVFKAYKLAYKHTANTCGDDLAVALKAATTAEDDDGNEFCDIAAVRAIATRNGIDAPSVHKAPNPGMARMNLSNMLRARVRNNAKVRVPGFQGEPEAVHAAKCWGADIWALAGTDAGDGEGEGDEA